MRALVLFLAAGMLFTGTINTIATKFQDLTVVAYNPDGTPVTFLHPGVQSACMFFGEFLCLVPYAILRWRRNRRRAARGEAPSPPKPLGQRVQRMAVFAIPSVCDSIATTLLNVGLAYTYASTYQMLRGTLVLFAGFFTVTILRRRLFSHHWIGMVLICAGAAIVGASSIIHSHRHNDVPPVAGSGEMYGSGNGEGGGSGAMPGLLGALYEQAQNMAALPGVLLQVLRDGPSAAPAPLFGDLMVVLAQGFTALQFILEEKFLKHYMVQPLLAVGLEGFWGCLLCLGGLPLLANLRDATGRPVDDAVLAVKEMGEHPGLMGWVLLSIVSIAFFNFFGLSVTKALSGANRATIDAMRTLLIWLISMGLGWEHFQGLQVLGFVVLVTGTSLYNELLRSCMPSMGPDDLSEGKSPRKSKAASPRTPPPWAAPGAPDAEWGGSGSGGDLAAPLLAAQQGEVGPAGAALVGGSRGQGARGGYVPPEGYVAGPSGQIIYDPAHIGAASHQRAARRMHQHEYNVMARSLRMGGGALSPHDLEEDEEESEGEPEPSVQGSSYDMFNSLVASVPTRGAGPLLTPRPDSVVEEGQGPGEGRTGSVSSASGSGSVSVSSYSDVAEGAGAAVRGQSLQQQRQGSAPQPPPGSVNVGNIQVNLRTPTTALSGLPPRPPPPQQ